MKDRMRRLSILFMAASLCTGTVYAEAENIDAVPEAYAETTENGSVETEPIQSEPAQTEPVQPETEPQEVHTETEAVPAESNHTEVTEEDPAQTTQESQAEGKSEENSTSDDRNGEITGTEGEAETENSDQAEDKKEKEELILKDETGAILQLEKLNCPKSLTVENETHPVNYQDGVYKVTVPENSRQLQITVPGQEESEEILLTKWNGYLTELEQNWYLCPDDPIEGAYTKQDQVYTVDLKKNNWQFTEILQMIRIMQKYWYPVKNVRN